MATHVCDLRLTAEAVEASYTGTVRYVQAQSREGARLRFPLAWLRRYVTRDGIAGTFVITIDAANRLQALRRLDEPAGSGAQGRSAGRAPRASA
jgi:hypothetical protein